MRGILPSAYALGVRTPFALWQYLTVHLDCGARSVLPVCPAAPMAARVANKVNVESNPHTFLLMRAIVPNVAGAIGSTVATGVLLACYS